MITVQEIVARCNSALDSEGFERYKFDNDFRPAINYAIEWITSLYNSVFAENKLSEENLRDLIKIGVWQTNSSSQILFNVPNTSMWSVIAVYPKIYAFDTIVGTNYSPGDSVSPTGYKSNITYLRSDFSAKRLTLEEYNLSRENPFQSGNDIVTADSLIEYAYLNRGLLTEVTPNVASELVALSYLKKPDSVSVIGDSVEFPESITNMVVEKALDWISWKQGNQTTLKAVTEGDTAKLIQLTT